MPARNTPPPPSTHKKHIPPPAVKKNLRQLFINQTFRCLFREKLCHFIDNGLPLPFLLRVSSGPRQQELSLLLSLIYTMAIGAMKALKDQGLRVPEDCAVVGFDDIDLSSVWEPAITTIRQPKEMMGRIAFQKLLALMQNEPIAVSQEYLPYELVIRESCGYFL